MASNFRRQQIVERLGVKQAPAVTVMAESASHTEHGFEIPVRTRTILDQQVSESVQYGQDSWSQSGEDHDHCGSSNEGEDHPYEHRDCSMKVPIGNDFTMPARKCPTCANNGQTVWVIPGKQCPICYALID